MTLLADLIDLWCRFVVVSSALVVGAGVYVVRHVVKSRRKK